MAESGGVPIPGETALITAARARQPRQAADRVGDRAGGRRRDRRRQHRLPDRPQGRALAARTARAGSTASAGRCCRSASRSSNATARRPCSSGASSSACACGPRGSPAPRACTGARSRCGTRSAGSRWATAIGLLAYFLGSSAGNAIEAFGIYGLVAAVARDRQLLRPASSRQPRIERDAAAARATQPRATTAPGATARSPSARRRDDERSDAGRCLSSRASSRRCRERSAGTCPRAAMSSSSEKREKNCSRTTARCVTRASCRRVAPAVCQAGIRAAGVLVAGAALEQAARARAGRRAASGRCARAAPARRGRTSASARRSRPRGGASTS